jgi:hypothetical protein
VVRLCRIASCGSSKMPLTIASPATAEGMWDGVEAWSLKSSSSASEWLASSRRRASRGEVISTSTQARCALVLDVLRTALHQRAPHADITLIHHGDAGSQYTSFDYTPTLDDHGVLASTGAVGDTLDNAAAESFVYSFKTELTADRTRATRSQRHRVSRLVQQRAPTPSARGLSTPRSRGPLRCAKGSHDTHPMKVGNLQTQSRRTQDGSS